MPGPAEFEKMMSMITGFWVSQTVGAAADLSIAEHLEGGQSTAEEISTRESSDPGKTFRLMRACAALGLLSYNSDNDTFTGTVLLKTLQKGGHNSLREWALVQTSPGHWLPWGKFTDAVRKGQPQTHEVLGDNIFAYFSEHPDEASLFSSAMTNLSTPVIREAVAVIDTQDVGTAVDIGGANGTFVLELMTANPTLQGVVLDLPHVIPGAEAQAQLRGLSDRFIGTQGDFFDSIPAGDLYLLKYILHDWDDGACVKILTNCRRNMNPGARLVVVDMLLGKVGESGIGTLMDMNMIAMVTGQERDLKEFDHLFSLAGLRRTKLTSVQQPYHVIEAVAD